MGDIANWTYRQIGIAAIAWAGVILLATFIAAVLWSFSEFLRDR